MQRWRVHRMPCGGYEVWRGAERWPMREPVDIEGAKRIAETLNRPACITPAEFQARTAHVPMRDTTRAALRAVLVDGCTWRVASSRHDVTESGILRAMRRIAQLNPTLRS